MRDDGQVWCDPGKRLVLRREVMKVPDRSLRSPALRKEPLPGGDLSLGLSIVERREEPVGRSHTILERRMQWDLGGHRVVAPRERLQRRCEVGCRDVEPGKERGCVGDRTRLAERPCEEPNGPAFAVEGRGEIAGDLRRPAARVEEQPHRYRLSHGLGSISRASSACDAVADLAASRTGGG